MIPTTTALAASLATALLTTTALAAPHPGHGPTTSGPGPLPSDERAAVKISAHLEPGALEPGSELAFVIDVELPEDVTTTAAGVPAPFLQLDVPESVKLGGVHLTTYRDLASNGFLQFPFERLLEDTSTRVAFELRDAPGEDETIGIIVTAYVTAGDEAMFLRRRLELPLKAAAQAVPGDDRDSSWGKDDDLLAIGDRAADFALPGPEDTHVDLSASLGDGNLLVTTYRAHW